MRCSRCGHSKRPGWVTVHIEFRAPFDVRCGHCGGSGDEPAHAPTKGKGRKGTSLAAGQKVRDNRKDLFGER